jgi:hypothetical protein
MADEKPEPAPPAPYVEDVVPGGLILRIAAGTVVFSIVLCLVAYLILRHEEGGLRPSRFFPERQLGAPHDVSAIREDLFEMPTPAATLKERQAQKLESYGWVDQQQHLVRIPVERAIDLVLARGAGKKP